MMGFSKSVQMDSLLCPEECRARLAQTTIPTLSLRRLNPFAKEMLTGSFTDSGGRLRPKMKALYFVSGRDLYFELLPLETGTRLVGRLGLSLGLRLYVTIYSVFCLFNILYFLAADVHLRSISHASAPGGLLWLVKVLVMVPLSLWVFCWFCIWMGRSDERALLTLVHRVVQSPETRPPKGR